MAATTQLWQDTGAPTGSPAQGTSQNQITNVYFKSVDNTTTPYTGAPVAAGSNSYGVYVYLKFAGTFNQILNVRFAHTAGTATTGITMKGQPTSVYTQPSTADTGDADITTPIAITAGAPVLVSPSSPADPAAGSIITTAGTTQYIRLQQQTAPTTAQGDVNTLTYTIQYDEN